MKKEILKEICENLNLKERIIVRVFEKTFIKVYNKTRIKLVNIIVR